LFRGRLWVNAQFSAQHLAALHIDPSGGSLFAAHAPRPHDAAVGVFIQIVNIEQSLVGSFGPAIVAFSNRLVRLRAEQVYE
jgi:hypothetical protein